MSLPESVPFGISVHDREDAVALVLSGEFDMCEAAEFRSRVDGVIASSAGAVVVDLADVTFIDSTAIGALLDARRCLGGEGRELRLEHVTAPVSRLFELTGLTDLLRDTAVSDD